MEHLNRAAQGVWGPGAAEGADWLREQARSLQHGYPDQVLDALKALPVEGGDDPAVAGRKRDETLQYLEKRREQIDYAQFLALGYPIGSGSVESANKLVVENTAKREWDALGPGQREPMVALRGMCCSGPLG